MSSVNTLRAVTACVLVAIVALFAFGALDDPDAGTIKYSVSSDIDVQPSESKRGLRQSRVDTNNSRQQAQEEASLPIVDWLDVPAEYPFDPQKKVPQAAFVFGVANREGARDYDALRKKILGQIDAFRYFKPKLTNEHIELLMRETKAERAAAREAMKKYYDDHREWFRRQRPSDNGLTFSSREEALEAAKRMYGVPGGGFCRTLQVAEFYSNKRGTIFLAVADPNTDMKLYASYNEWLIFAQHLHDQMQLVALTKLGF